MLKNIPFYASLLQKEFADGTNPTSGLVLVYGAIEAHSFGERGCIASNKTIADECGLKATSVANAISVLNREGWIRVDLDENNHRVLITPLLEIARPPSLTSEPPFTVQVTPLHSTVNIEYSNKNTVRDIVSNDTRQKPKVYGNPEINSLFEEWERLTGSKIVSRVKQNRQAAHNLLRKFPYTDVIRLILVAAASHKDRYAPTISDFISLNNKLNELILWAKKQNDIKPKVVKI